MANILYIEDSQSIPSIKIDIDTNPAPTGYTASTNPTVDFDKYSFRIIDDGLLVLSEVRTAIESEYTSITWTTGTTEQKEIWSKWGVATISERDEVHTSSEQKNNAKLLYSDVEGDESSKKIESFADSFVASEPTEVGKCFDTVGAIIIDKDLNINSIHSTSSGTYARLAFQTLCLNPTDYGKTKVEMQINVDYLTDSSVTGRVEIFDYTDFISIANTEYDLPDVSVWSYEESLYYDLTSYANKSLSLRFKRLTGTGNNKVYVEAVNFRFRLT